jgi:hypothetical protein
VDVAYRGEVCLSPHPPRLFPVPVGLVLRRRRVRTRLADCFPLVRRWPRPDGVFRWPLPLLPASAVLVPWPYPWPCPGRAASRSASCLHWDGLRRGIEVAGRGHCSSRLRGWSQRRGRAVQTQAGCFPLTQGDPARPGCRVRLRFPRASFDGPGARPRPFLAALAVSRAAASHCRSGHALPGVGTACRGAPAAPDPSALPWLGACLACLAFRQGFPACTATPSRPLLRPRMRLYPRPGRPPSGLPYSLAPAGRRPGHVETR